MKKILLAALVLSSLALAATQTTQYFLMVNGSPSSLAVVVNQGNPYIHLETLRQLGISVQVKGNTITLNSPKTIAPAGGTNQRASLEGCMGETLFNGVWRMTAKSVKPISRYNGQQSGYSVALEWKNGTNKTIDALNTGVKTLTLVLADGSTLESENVQDLLYKKLPQAAGNTLELSFYAGSSKARSALPAKLLVEIKAAEALSSGVSYSTPTPSFRVNLACQK